MIPTFTDDRKRKINLGGVLPVTTHAAIIDRVREERSIRAQQKCRVEKAIRMQAWWSGVREVRYTKMEMRKAFEADVTGITRNLEMVRFPYPIYSCHSCTLENVFAPASALGDQRNSWLVLIRQACLFLLQSIADSPQCVISCCFS